MIQSERPDGRLIKAGGQLSRMVVKWEQVKWEQVNEGDGEREMML